MNSKEEEIFSEEIIKIIDSNQLKASTLRNSLLSLNQNINNLNIQIIQFLGEFEYDLKTLKELINEYKNTSKKKCEQNLKYLKKELNNVKKENNSLKELIDNINKNKFNKPNFENKNNKKAEIKRSKNKNENNKDNNNTLEIRNYNYSTKSFNINKNKNNYSNISNNDRNQHFYDYNSFLSHIKKNNNTNNKFCGVIKYDIYKQKSKTNLKDNENINRSVRVKSAGKTFYNKNINEEKKQKIINKIFQDEKIINALKNNFGNEIEDKLLNDDINIEFLSKIEEIIEKIKNNNNIQSKNTNNETIQESNRSYNLKIPKRYSNNKDNNFISNFIISS